MTPTALEMVWTHPTLPFHVGLFDSPQNPAGFPGTLPFELGVHPDTGVMSRPFRQDIADHLDRAYARGSILGTAMDATEMGVGYADDFLGFLVPSVGELKGKRCLEIGAGRGYLLRRLGELGADAVGIEPGDQHQANWAEHGVNVVQTTFPTEKVEGPFDVVLSYGVLEHIPSPAPFLEEVSRVLTPEGLLVIAVPDCEAYLRDGDPSALVHQHYHYFTESTLQRLLASSGYERQASAHAGHGSVLYAAARHRPAEAKPAPLEPEEFELARAFGPRCNEILRTLRARVEELAEQEKTLGVYCPTRAINVLPEHVDARFFDDDTELQGRWIPPFPHPIESRERLIADPVDELWIMTRTFGDRILRSLRQHPELADVRIRPLTELLAGSGPTS